MTTETKREGNTGCILLLIARDVKTPEANARVCA